VSRLDPGKLHVRLAENTLADEPVIPRCNTLTHSDATGELFLTVAAQYDRGQISGVYTRLLRDEVLAEWKSDGDRYELVVHCHVSGGFVLGTAAWRYAIFRRELPLVLEAFRHGDSALYEKHPPLDGARVSVRFHAKQERFDRTEDWGTPSDYTLRAE
jgi:hypothetical protein